MLEKKLIYCIYNVTVLLKPYLSNSLPLFICYSFALTTVLNEDPTGNIDVNINCYDSCQGNRLL